MIGNKSFKRGTIYIKESGTYKLEEDILFAPNPDNDFRPKIGDPAFEEGEFSCALNICAPKVCLDLSGHTLGISNAFRIQIRNFCAIKISGGSLVTIRGGKIQGDAIQCFGIKTLVLENLAIYEYREKAISCQDCHNLIISSLSLEDNYPLDGGLFPDYCRAREVREITRKWLRMKPQIKNYNNLYPAILRDLEKIEEWLVETFDEIIKMAPKSRGLPHQGLSILSSNHVYILSLKLNRPPASPMENIVAPIRPKIKSLIKNCRLMASILGDNNILAYKKPSKEKKYDITLAKCRAIEIREVSVPRVLIDGYQAFNQQDINISYLIIKR